MTIAATTAALTLTLNRSGTLLAWGGTCLTTTLTSDKMILWHSCVHVWIGPYLVMQFTTSSYFLNLFMLDVIWICFCQIGFLLAFSKFPLYNIHSQSLSVEPSSWLRRKFCVPKAILYSNCMESITFFQALPIEQLMRLYKKLLPFMI